ncbi:hypothetical protein DFO55_11886 [Grimontella sp. AG753]|nr:hypothetical protein DFO55_11886 [Grimontella sp. AG753]
MAKAKLVHLSPVVGGVDTQKILHVAAVVDQNNRVLGSEFFRDNTSGVLPDAGLDGIFRNS